MGIENFAAQIGRLHSGEELGVPSHDRLFEFLTSNGEPELCAVPQQRHKHPRPDKQQFTQLLCQLTMQEGDIDDNWDDVRDLVEPLRTPRIREAVVAPWLERRGRARNELPADSQRLLDDNSRSFREFILLGGDSAGNIEGDGAEGDGNAVPSWLSADGTAASTHSSDSAPQRLLSFLLRDRPQTVVVWLSRNLFLACDGPGSRVLRDYSAEGWCYRSVAFFAYAKTVGGGERSFRLCLGVAGGGGDDGETTLRYRSEEAGDWPPALAAMIARSAAVSGITCHLIAARHHRTLLEAVVSPAPPLPGGRDLAFDLQVEPFTEDAYRVLAHRTHPDTRLEITLWQWGLVGAAVLAEAIRTNRGPKRLLLKGADHLEMVEPLANALRVTNAVEELEFQLSPGRTPETQRCNALLLDAVGDNVGLRTFQASHVVCRDDVCNRVKAFWTSVLRSRTLTNVNLQGVTSEEPPRASDRQEVARHVVELLKSNRVVTDLQYDPDLHDATIMEAHAVPLLQWNRLRAAPVDVKNRCWLSFLASKPVRRHPMLRYHLLRGSVDAMVRHLQKSSSSSLGSEESEVDGRRRKRARLEDRNPP
jgi:hypothetical protein